MRAALFVFRSYKDRQYFRLLHGTVGWFGDYVFAVRQYRFITRNRKGKWYDLLSLAQVNAERIGAGFLDGSGEFIPYRGTVLEFRSKP